MKGPPAATGRSPARATALIVGGVIVVVLAIVLVLSSGGGGKSTGQGSGAGQGTKTTASTSNGAHQKQLSSHRSASSGVGAGAVSPASTTVAVLNGTSTNGLAHSLSKDLQQSGYSQAAALSGTPPGSHASTVVEYASGHHAEAQGVASALSVTQVQPMETAVASLAGAATVVVIAGEDKAAALGASGGEASGAGASGAAG